MKNILTISFLLFITGSFGYAQTNSSSAEIDSLVSQISKGNLSGPTLGMMGHGTHKSEQYLRYKRLSEIASNEQLIVLTDHSSPVVRCYAFDALSKRNIPDYYKIIKRHFSDTDQVSQINYDMINDAPVGVYLHGVFSSYLQKLEPGTDSLYNFLKGFVLSSDYPSAIVAIAKYKKEADTSLIISYLDNEKPVSAYGVTAIKLFPSTAFFSKLKSMLNEVIADPAPFLGYELAVFEALVQYKTYESVALMKTALIKSKVEPYSSTGLCMYVALEKYPDPIFAELKNEIKLADFQEPLIKLLINNPVE